MATYSKSQWWEIEAKKSRNVFILILNRHLTKRKKNPPKTPKGVITSSKVMFWEEWNVISVKSHILIFWGVALALVFRSPCEPQCCQTDLRRAPSSDWPAPSESSLHQRTSQSAAEEAPQCPVLTAPRPKQDTQTFKGPIHNNHTKNYIFLLTTQFYFQF